MPYEVNPKVFVQTLGFTSITATPFYFGLMSISFRHIKSIQHLEAKLDIFLVFIFFFRFKDNCLSTIRKYA